MAPVLLCEEHQDGIVVFNIHTCPLVSVARIRVPEVIPHLCHRGKPAKQRRWILSDGAGNEMWCMRWGCRCIKCSVFINSRQTRMLFKVNVLVGLRNNGCMKTTDFGCFFCVFPLCFSCFVLARDLAWTTKDWFTAPGQSFNQNWWNCHSIFVFFLTDQLHKWKERIVVLNYLYINI